jgi:hypothetical protein
MVLDLAFMFVAACRIFINILMYNFLYMQISYENMKGGKVCRMHNLHSIFLMQNE